MQTFDRSRQSLSAAVTRMASDSPYEAVLIADGGRIAAQAVPVARQSGGADARVLGTELWNTETDAVGRPPRCTAPGSPASPDGLYRQLATKYRARYGSAPYRISSLGYDAVLLVTRIAQDWRPGQRLPGAGGCSTMAASAASTARSASADDGIAERALEVQQIAPAGFTTVSPAPARFAE